MGEWENGTRHGQGIYVGDKQVKNSQAQLNRIKIRETAVHNHFFPLRKIYVGGFSHGRREGEGEVYSMEGDQVK